MNTQEKLESMLVERGMFEDTARQIIESVKPAIDAAAPGYCVTWDRPSGEYPDQVYNVLYVSFVRPAALTWIESNFPGAWYRSLI